MAIAGSGLYFLTFEKMLIDTAGQSMEAESQGSAIVTDSYTPAYDTHDFRNDLTNVEGTGNLASTTDWTVAAGVWTYDVADIVHSAVTYTSGMANVGYAAVGADTTDQLWYLQDFVTAASSTAADFTVQIHANGVVTIDAVP